MSELDTKISALMTTAIEKHLFPGGVVGYIKKDATQVLPFGRTTYQLDAPSVTADTVYDLASVTKSIPTASITLALIEQGQLSLDDQAIKYIPELAMAGREAILIRHLLSFTAVFELHQHLSTYAKEGREALLQRILTTPLKYPPGEHFLYADIPYLLLGMIAERALGKPLDVVADDMFFHPLGMHTTTFHPETLSSSVQVAPTEINGRGEVVREVHDEKAWTLYKEGQIPGNAGLFSTAGDLLRYCQMLLNSGELAGQRYFAPSTIALMQTEIVRKDDAGFSYGWMSHAAFMSPSLTPGVFGKSGYTGTTVVVDVIKQCCIVLLTNRTYPKRPDSPAAPMQELRRQLADFVFA